MRSSRATFSVCVALRVGAMALVLSGAVAAQAAEGSPATAADAAQQLANTIDSNAAGISGNELVTALEDAAKAGQPMALYQLGLMYENGEGVARDPAKAFGYFSQIADEHADTPPKGVEAEIVGQSFLKVGEYYRTGLPEAGIDKNEAYSNKLILYAASFFGDADAQYKVGEMYLDEQELGDNALMSARWLNLAARKGHAPAQAKLGDMLFNGEGLGPDPIQGLMWLTVASHRAAGTPDEAWINDLLNNAVSIATPDERKKATELASNLGKRFGGL